MSQRQTSPSEDDIDSPPAGPRTVPFPHVTPSEPQAPSHGHASPKTPRLTLASSGENPSQVPSILLSIEQQIKAEKIIPYPRYNDLPHNNDVMLIKLKKPAILNKYVKPIPLTKSCSSEGMNCLVSGWGRTGAGPASTLQCLDLPVLSMKQCMNAYRSVITKNMFCAGFMKGGKDSCQGDSGGPVVCNGKLQGVVSFGQGCAQPGYPGVYVELCRYNSWINHTIATN
ncbi:myofibril-bound serine ase [Labeo rohita]|uniref:trypsin n=1 Tax=Labeo rohita TaxID=84645 RepID=A0A498L946_LABRO|nr:myofibril-bound serine ase [Labeo rohita]RXN25207.1 myofibril-bound serine ase [Labeo rohita]RXN34379.1 myofibril-bound serine ase [Labeo rohita]